MIQISINAQKTSKVWRKGTKAELTSRTDLGASLHM
jgi:hypothetical protein